MHVLCVRQALNHFTVVLMPGAPLGIARPQLF